MKNDCVTRFHQLDRARAPDRYTPPVFAPAPGVWARLRQWLARTPAPGLPEVLACHDEPNKTVGPPWYPFPVSVPDAGGRLYAPCAIYENEYIQSGHTPSYNEEGIRRLCVELNAFGYTVQIPSAPARLTDDRVRT